VLWGADRQLRDLGMLGGNNSRAYDINDVGVIVGTVDNAGVVWQDNRVKALDNELVAGSDWNINAATGINDAGQIVGFAQQRGELHLVLLTPTG
jgi:hypothetical protein